ncbi:DUF1127 domain-containing protein [Chelatococcus sp. SYSU_G07232]|uniref:DUF1127 domain-containing protein n=1 Tax=Chelatococcus albus TaxID=3047466 RepID=A0ABT7ALA2_9HYPH|nr:DUF1127 domain-containing protein [Chelatococcus sp. SYSU_G07232]MDJ1160155.1 DUF1127 domain-containing protein [Chelatococcus sp. SYSU_G07232]
MHAILAPTTGRENLGLLPSGGLARALLSLLDTLDTWATRVAQRRALERLDGHMLHDLGLSRADVEREAGKPFWRA